MKRRDLFKLVGGTAVAAVATKVIASEPKPLVDYVSMRLDPKTGDLHVQKDWRHWRYNIDADLWEEIN